MSSLIRRILVIAGVVAVLGVLAIGAASAAGLGGAATTPVVAAAPSSAPDASGGSGAAARDEIDQLLKNHPLLARRLERLLKRADHLVHVEATVTDKDGKLVHLQADHGTIQSIGNGSIAIAEAGGTSVTVSTDGDTKVRLGRDLGKLSDLKVGDEIYVHSRVDGSTALAKRVIRFPADAS